MRSRVWALGVALTLYASTGCEPDSSERRTKQTGKISAADAMKAQDACLMVIGEICSGALECRLADEDLNSREQAEALEACLDRAQDHIPCSRAAGVSKNLESCLDAIEESSCKALEAEDPPDACSGVLILG